MRVLQEHVYAFSHILDTADSAAKHGLLYGERHSQGGLVQTANIQVCSVIIL